MPDFEGQEAWVGIAEQMHERSHAFHQASLLFLKKAESDHLNAAIAVRCNQEATKLDVALLKGRCFTLIKTFHKCKGGRLISLPFHGGE